MTRLTHTLRRLPVRRPPGGRDRHGLRVRRPPGPIHRLARNAHRPGYPCRCWQSSSRLSGWNSDCSRAGAEVTAGWSTSIMATDCPHAMRICLQLRSTPANRSRPDKSLARLARQGDQRDLTCITKPGCAASLSIPRSSYAPERDSTAASRARGGKPCKAAGPIIFRGRLIHVLHVLRFLPKRLLRKRRFHELIEDLRPAPRRCSRWKRRCANPSPFDRAAGRKNDLVAPADVGFGSLLSSSLLFSLLELHLIKPRPQHLPCLGAIAMLGTVVLAVNHDIGWDMGEADRRTRSC